MGTEMFHFPTFPPHTLYIQMRVTTHNMPRGFPIRTPSDHRSFTNSPRLIADYRVLHRPLMPRHPPCALEHSPPHTKHTQTPKGSHAREGDKTNNTRNTKTNKITTTTHSVIARCSRPLFTKQTTTTHPGHHPQHTGTTIQGSGKRQQPHTPYERVGLFSHNPTACLPTPTHHRGSTPSTSTPQQHTSAEVSQCSTHEHPTHPPWMSGLTTTHPTTNQQAAALLECVCMCCSLERR